MLDAGVVVRDLQNMRDEGHLSDALLRKAVRSISTADGRYDWVGVYLHGLAGDLARDAYGERSVVAQDLIDKLPAAIKSLEA